MTRLTDAVLDTCRCDPVAPFALDPNCDLGLDKAQAKARLSELRRWLGEQQQMLWANHRAAQLLVLQGPDCSGKDGVIRRVLGGLDPLHLRIDSFHAPDAEERRHDFLWRYRQRLPAPGQLGVFNRSYYEGLVSDPLDGLCEAGQLPARLAQLLAFEATLPGQSIGALKCYLHISRDEQKRRLLERLNLPSKRWKLHEHDLRDHHRFEARQQRWAGLLKASHSPLAPWYVIPANLRWVRDLLVASLLAREFERLALDWPDRPAPFTAEQLD
jgi:polyphosphate kinase 2 (PPK2 family)